MRLTHYDEYKKRWQINDDYGAVVIDALNYAIGEAIDKLAAYEDAEEKFRWIPVTERLPEKTNDYLVHVKCECDGNFVSAWEQVAWFCEKFYWDHRYGDDVFEETVTHWMPLPEPPKEET